MNAKYTVITGASRGLGKALARECARRKMNVLLVSLPGEEIHHYASELSARYNISAMGYEADLTESEQVHALTGWIKSGFQVDMLINNAGIGGTRKFMDTPADYLNQIMLLNMRALVLITHALLPLLDQHPQSYILNIASLASAGPMPYKTVYPASKAFVYSFTRGLHAELTGSNIFVSVAQPGAMATNSEISYKIKRYNHWIRNLIISPEKTAEICIRKLIKKDAVILPGILNKFLWYVFQYSPVKIRMFMFGKVFRREMKQVQSISYAD